MMRPNRCFKAIFLGWLTLATYSIPATAQEGSSAMTLAKNDVGEIPNPNPLLNQGLIPGFRLKESSLAKGSKGPWLDILRESWIKDPSSGASDLSWIKIDLHPRQNRVQAMKCAEDCYGADTDANQTPGLGIPFPGSYSGQSIGDYCWAYVYSLLRIKGEPRPALNESGALVVVSDRYCFSISVTGPGDSNQGFEDAFLERLAKSVVERLKTWQPPG